MTWGLRALERAKARPVTEARVRQIIADVGGGGGPVAWGDVTGKPSVFPPDAHTQAASTITDFSEAVDDRVAALLAAGANITLTYNDVTNTLTIAATGGGAGLSGLATVTVPNNRLEWSQTVAAVGVTPSQRIMVALGSHLDADENDAEMLDVAAMSAAAGTDQITFEMAFSTPTAGPIKINWSAV